MPEDAPFNTKIKLECDCGNCQSKYKIIFFEDDTTGDIKVCPFCGEQVDEFAETNASEESEEIAEETIYTDDDYSRYESDVVDDDDIPSDAKL